MKALIIANGPLIPLREIRKLAAGADVIVCADGGANAAKEIGVRVDAVVGDLDSIRESARKFFRNLLVQNPGQETTDLEKAIQYCRKRRASEIDIVGGIGGRLDHTLANLGAFLKDDLNLRFIDKRGELTRVNGVAAFTVQNDEVFSLIPLTFCSGVTVNNARFPLANEALLLGGRGISNVARRGTVRIKVKRGVLLLYRHTRKRVAT